MKELAVRIYLSGYRDTSIELDGQGMDADGMWELRIAFKPDYIWVKKRWTNGNEQVLYTIPKTNLYYVDWGNWNTESEI